MVDLGSDGSEMFGLKETAAMNNNSPISFSLFFQFLDTDDPGPVGSRDFCSIPMKRGRAHSDAVILCWIRFLELDLIDYGPPREYAGHRHYSYHHRHYYKWKIINQRSGSITEKRKILNNRSGASCDHDLKKLERHGGECGYQHHPIFSFPNVCLFGINMKQREEGVFHFIS